MVCIVVYANTPDNYGYPRSTGDILALSTLIVILFGPVIYIGLAYALNTFTVHATADSLSQVRTDSRHKTARV